MSGYGVCSLGILYVLQSLRAPPGPAWLWRRFTAEPQCLAERVMNSIATLNAPST
jgi:hypothetical protein